MELCWLVEDNKVIAVIAVLALIARGTMTNDRKKEGVPIAFASRIILSMSGSAHNVNIAVPKITCSTDLQNAPFNTKE